MPSWPDEGRRIVQGPVLKRLFRKAAHQQHHFRRVLNAGTGESGFAFLLASLPGVEQLIETDISVAGGRARITSKQVFFCSSLTDIPLADHTIDFILCTEVLEHIPDDQKALDELARVLAPEGWLLISVPTPPAVPDPACSASSVGYLPIGHSCHTVQGFSYAECPTWTACFHSDRRWI